jgi:hypothetical protein
MTPGTISAPQRGPAKPPIGGQRQEARGRRVYNAAFEDGRLIGFAVINAPTDEIIDKVARENVTIERRMN